MRDSYQPRAMAYSVPERPWFLMGVFVSILALAAIPALAQDDITPAPGELSEEAVTADVPDDQVKKVTIDGEGVAEVLDVDDVGAPDDSISTAPINAPPVASPETANILPAPAETTTNLTWDERIERDLLERLDDDPLIGADSVTVDSSNGEVILSGTVGTLSGKNRAGQLARMMRGVQVVTNNLTVRPSELDDATVEQYVQATLRQEPSIASNDIVVTVQNGQATLSGVVDSWQEKNLAEDLAEQTRGVVAVTSRLEVGATSTERAADQEIAARVQQRLRTDPWVAAENVDVNVSNGEVVLSGTVHSLSQRERAFANAWVEGVQSVDATGLGVLPFDQARAETTEEVQPPRRETPNALSPLTNEEIQQAIVDTYNYSPRLGEFRPTVTVDNGVVVLTGTASTVRAKNLAEELTKNVRGVWKVENRIDVRADQAYTDTELAERIREQLDNHPDLSRLDVAVTVMEGAAYLSGSVTSPMLQREAGEVASNVPGIKTVYNETSLSEAVAAKDDFELKQDIESALYWSPFVDLDDVEITVTQGVATLTGTVERWASRLAAEESALQMGAVQVNNRLRVLEGPAELRAQAPQPTPVIDQRIVQD